MNSKPEEHGPYDDERDVAALLAELEVRSDDDRDESGPYEDDRDVAALLAELEVRSDDERDESGPYDDDEVAALLAELDGVPLARSFMARGPGGYLAEVLVDAPDYDRIMRGPAWRLQRFNYGKPGPVRYYVARTSGGVTELLNRIVMADEIAPWAGPGRAVVDHISGNPLDNRRCNLRVVSYRENRANSRKSALPTSSRFKGVSLLRGRWVAKIRRQGRQVYLGYFDDEEDAARAYDAAARAEFGACACLNYPREGEQCARRPSQA